MVLKTKILSNNQAHNMNCAFLMYVWHFSEVAPEDFLSQSDKDMMDTSQCGSQNVPQY